MSEPRKTLGDELRERAEQAKRDREEAERRRDAARQKFLRDEEAETEQAAKQESEPIFRHCRKEARNASASEKKALDVVIQETRQWDHFDRRLDDTPEYRTLKLRTYACNEAARRLADESIRATCEITVWDDTERGGAEDYYPKNVTYRLVMRLSW